DRLDEFEHELDEPDEQRDAARRDPVLELVEREELARVAAEAEALEPLELEIDEADQGEPEGDVDVARRRPKLVDAPDRRDEAAPVAEQDQQEEGGEQRDVRARRRAGDTQAEV